ncbi:hypothetical protein Apa02nite_091050 [Actinoplanes palleronii]|uniref:Uncharacterized protein n=1 Tax=Actinoplanes palleronii TaxID=113570 RepID=A0ABQ4BQP4_9ACTN|nr:hypothetical protein Apa02nite_091050 [Actinoplanes palleronii]
MSSGFPPAADDGGLPLFPLRVAAAEAALATGGWQNQYARMLHRDGSTRHVRSRRGDRARRRAGGVSLVR